MKIICFLIGVLILLFTTSCHKSTNDDFTICGTTCSAGSPWTVESLDQGLPCFNRQDSCLRWAQTHGYSDTPCVECDR